MSARYADSGTGPEYSAVEDGNVPWRGAAQLCIEGLPEGYTAEAVELEQFEPIFRELRGRVFDERATFFWEQALTELEKERRDRLAERVRADGRIRHHILFKRGDELAGWYFGQQETAVRYLMVNTALFPEHRRKGIYTALLRSLLPHLEALGFQEVVSLHHATNNPVLIAKLKAGFLITGMEIDDRFGLLVRLTYFTNPVRRRMMAVRTWETWPDEELLGYLGAGRNRHA